MSRNPNTRFNEIRLFVSSMVVLIHCFPLAGQTRPIWLTRVTGADALGGPTISAMFILSGYLMAMSWLARPNAATFLRHRLIRLYPALIAVVVLTVTVLGPLLTTLPIWDYARHDQTLQYLSNATAWSINFRLPGVFSTTPYEGAVNGSLWTMPYFLQLCMAIVAMGVIARGQLAFRHLTLAALVGLSLIYMLRPVDTQAWTKQFGLDYFHIKLGGFFMLGAAMASWEAKWKPSLAWGIPLYWLGRALPTELGMLLIWTGYAMLVIWVAQHARWIPRMPAHWGDWSYGCYLWGFPIQQALAQAGLHNYSWWLFAVMSVVLSIVAGAASWHLVEKHANRWR